MSNYVLYHSNCYDGFCAAWVCKNALPMDTVFTACAYGDPLPEIPDGSNVFMVDFSFPRDVLITLSERTKLVVLDHHKTAQANCEGLDFCTFDMNRSGAGLTWDYFHKGNRKHNSDGTQILVNYVEDRDLWRFAQPHSKAFHAWLSSHPMDFAEWDNLAMFVDKDKVNGGWGRVVDSGESILRYASQKVDETCKQVQFRDVANYKAIPTVNCPYSMGSDACHKLLQDYPEAPFTAYYLDRGDGEQQWGLRGRDTDEFDVSEVAKSLGGGGHRKASGFVKGKVTR